MSDPEVTPELAREHGLSDHEIALIGEILGRRPSFPELGIFSVMWSEHCSYKSSKRYLQTLPTKGPAVVQGPGENAGVVDVGDGNVCVFKIESHNHPSYVEPHGGAATGVGGILRDIFTMGARPLASLDSLRFGSLDDPHQRYLVRGVVTGIGDYGNCFGCATVGGEVTFHPRYRKNILVNAMNVGIARDDEIFLAKASGTGNPVIYVGSKTGRDGIHGASLLASTEFDEETEAKRPTVQLGDPFTEKLLLEACLEAMKTGAIVGIQDMGAAGLTCSSFEMASRSGTGIEMDLDRVPQRETNMTPTSCCSSESQERMLLVAEAGREKEILDVFAKWDLDAAIVGRVTDDGRMRVRWHGAVVVDIPVDPVAANAPVYDRPTARPADLETRRTLDLAALPAESDPSGALLQLLASPNLCSRDWVYQQYDQLVQGRRCSGRAATPRSCASPRPSAALALTTDCNPRYCALDPYLGAQHAVAEAARNVAVTGARPLRGDQLPELRQPGAARAHVGVRRGRARHGRRLPRARHADRRRQRQLLQRDRRRGRDPAHADDRHGRAARRRAPRGARRLPRPRRRRDPPGRDARRARRLRVPVGAPRPRARRAADPRPRGREAPARAPGRPAARGLLRSAHDCSDGGAAVALAECAIRAGIGVEVELPARAACAPRSASSASRPAARSSPARPADARRSSRSRANTACRPPGSAPPAASASASRPGVDVAVAEAHDVWTRTLPEALAATTGSSSTASARSAAWSASPGHPEAANLAYLGLYALQHRGQESAGIVVARRRRLPRPQGHGPGRRHLLRRTLLGEPARAAIAIGHVRYSTAGASNLRERAAVPGRHAAARRSRSRTTAT